MRRLYTLSLKGIACADEKVLNTVERMFLDQSLEVKDERYCERIRRQVEAFPHRFVSYDEDFIQDFVVLYAEEVLRKMKEIPIRIDRLARCSTVFLVNTSLRGYSPDKYREKRIPWLHIGHLYRVDAKGVFLTAKKLIELRKEGDPRITSAFKEVVPNVPLLEEVPNLPLVAIAK